MTKPLSQEQYREKFDAGYSIVPITGCWMWMGHLTPEEYPVLGSSFGTTFLAHRHAYERFVGPLQPGLVLDHLCRNRWCVNPAHLEQVTNGTNVLRGESLSARAARRQTCVHGHPYNTENTVRRSRGNRECRTCRRIAQGYTGRGRWPKAELVPR